MKTIRVTNASQNEPALQKEMEKLSRALTSRDPMGKTSEPSKFGAKRASVRIPASENKPFLNATARTSRNSTILQKSNTVRISDKPNQGPLKSQTNTTQAKESRTEAIKSKVTGGTFNRRNTMMPKTSNTVGGLLKSESSGGIKAPSRLKMPSRNSICDPPGKLAQT